MTIYVNRDGRKIKKQEWEKLQGNLKYATLRRYENKLFHAEVVWLGEIKPELWELREHWPLFELRAFNVVAGPDGARKLVKDPNFTHSYPDEKSAIEAYQSYLSRYTECWVEKSFDAVNKREIAQWVEHGNYLKPVEEEQSETDKVATEVLISNPIAGSW